MSNNILIKDNFYHDVDELRRLAFSGNYNFHRTKVGSRVAWRGFRTWELSYMQNPHIEECSQKIMEVASEFFNLTDHSIHKFFHISYAQHKINQIRPWHKDETTHAGILYLNPNPPSNGGTTVFVDKKRIDVDNKYNRLVAYRGDYKHGITNFFGDTQESGRMTFTFFIDIKKRFDRDYKLLEEFRKNQSIEYYKF